jgi:hypothetical protein
VICSIATRPKQFRPILEWSTQTASDRLVMLPSVHPDSPNVRDELRIIAGEGFPGIKMHPYYQETALDDERMIPIYEETQAQNLMLVSHTGFDIGFPRFRCADPARVYDVISHYPDLLFVATHMGGWQDWDNVENILLGKPVYIEISFTLTDMDAERARQFLTTHPADYLLFGTDSPWKDQARDLALLRTLNLPAELEQKILGANAKTLLDRAGI